jgi:hypothetical protein
MSRELSGASIPVLGCQRSARGRRAAPASPRSPVPSRMRLEGSGVTAVPPFPVPPHSPGRIGYASGKLPYNRLVGQIGCTWLVAALSMSDLACWRKPRSVRKRIGYTLPTIRECSLSLAPPLRVPLQTTAVLLEFPAECREQSVATLQSNQD